MNSRITEVIRYGLNGIIATVVHFSILAFNLHILAMPSAGIANFTAAFFGIISSFLGSRYFVFRNTDPKSTTQAVKFGGLYAFIAIIHGSILFIWTDWLALDYRIGFLMATLLQISLSYIGNKFLVFKA